jgi:hypothetical protein
VSPKVWQKRLFDPATPTNTRVLDCPKPRN